MSVSFAIEGNLGFITIDQPPANSYDLEVMKQFSDAVDDAIASDAPVVVVRSANPKFFSAGADIKRFLEGDVESNMEMIRVSQAAFKRMTSASELFIAYLAGHAMGGGLEIALACDIRVASAGRFRLGLPEVTLGLLPGNGGTQRLTRLVGPSRAMELLLTGRTYGVEEAASMGLIAAVFEAEDAEAKAREYAEKFASGPALALASIKRCVHDGAEPSLEDGLALEAELMEKLFRSKDASEGLHAFVEKRTPEFVGS
jgi:enoyl-CoA hydratase/carnithine racemase